MDVFIPSEILKIKDLNITEKVVLAIYKYYTEQGKYKCCSMSKPQIANELGISVDYMKDIKKHLNELGYIRTDGGVRVIYLGVQVGDITPAGGGYNTQGGGYNTRQVGDITPSKWGIYPPHKKEKKDKKEIKKEEKRIMTNFEKLIDRLPDYYLTEERMKYIEEKYKDKINELDMTDGAIDGWIIGIKNELNKVYPIEYKVEKVEKKEDNDTVDLF